jgi:DNA polymerase-3 subunit delta
MAKKKESGMPASAAVRRLAKSRPEPVYLIAGAEAFLAGEVVRAIAKAAGGKSSPAPTTTYDGKDVDLATLLDDLRTPDMFTPVRVVVVANAASFAQKNDAKLAEYAKSPASSGHLVLRTEKVDKCRKLLAAAKKTNAYVTCKAPYEREIVPWVRNRAKELGRTLQPAAAALLADFLGTDLGLIAAELDKLLVYAGERDTITAEDVEAISLRDRGRVVFELTDAIGGHEPGKLLAVLGDLLDRNEAVPFIIYMVSRHLRRLWAARELIEAGRSPQDAAAEVGVRYYADRFLAQARSFGIGGLRRSCYELTRCEAALKSSSVDPRVLLETTFVRLVRRRQQRRA